MSAVRLAKLERITNFARGIVAPLADVWSESAGATVLIESPQAEELHAGELAETLDGWFWVLPVEMTGVRSGALGLLIDQSLVVGPDAGTGPSEERSQARFAGIIDGFLARAADRLTASAGGPVTLDRLGLREVPGRQAAGILAEFLGRGELVAVSFTAEMASRAAGGASRTGEVGVVFGGKLARDLGGRRSAGAETIAVPRPGGRAPAEPDVPARARAEPGALAGTPPGRRPPDAAGPRGSEGGASARAGLASRSTAPGRARPSASARHPAEEIATGGAANAPPAAAGRSDVDALLERARGLRLRLSAEIGRRTLTVGELLRLRRGSAVDLSKSVTAPIELCVGTKRIALGDAVVLPGGFGVRIRGQAL